jgi:hypothetical protein
MRKNYILQNTNYKQITNYKLQITNKKAKGSYGLHQGAFKLQSMTALIKSFCRGSREIRNAQSARRKAETRFTLCAKRHAPCAFPLVAEGIRRYYEYL